MKVHSSCSFSRQSVKQLPVKTLFSSNKFFSTNSGVILKTRTYLELKTYARRKKLDYCFSLAPQNHSKPTWDFFTTPPDMRYSGIKGYQSLPEPMVGVE